MAIETGPMKQPDTGATVVITHRVCNEYQPDYEAWLNEIGPVCKAQPGHLDTQIIRPVSGLTATYTVVIRFDTHDHLESWMGSQERNRLIDKVRPLLATDDNFFIRSGLDFWFAPEGASARVPVRWKQFLITWSAIYPMVLIVPPLVIPLLRQAGLAEDRLIDTLCISGVIVTLMVYVVMPRYTKLVHRWLFK